MHRYIRMDDGPIVQATGPWGDCFAFIYCDVTNPAVVSSFRSVNAYSDAASQTTAREWSRLPLTARHMEGAIRATEMTARLA